MEGMDFADLSFYGFPTAPVFAGSSLDGSSGTGPRYWKFLTHEQQHRLERIRGARLLFNGRHREYFLQEQRTQFSFPSVQIGGIWGTDTRQIFETYNVLGLISRKGADLLFGDEPLLRVAAPADPLAAPATSPGQADEEDDQEPEPQATYVEVQEAAQREFLRDLVDRCDLGALFHQKAEDASCDAEAYLEAKIEQGEVWLADVPAEEIHPIGQPGPDRQYAQYDRFTVTQIPATNPNDQPTDLLLITHYKVGRIERECWQLQGGEKKRRLTMDQWPVEAGQAPLAEATITGLDVNTIVYVPNQLRHGRPVNDYCGVEHLQDALNAKMTQISWILAKHSQPILSRHSRHAAPDGTTRADYSVEFNDDQSEKSAYITWNGELQWALKDRDFTLEQLLVATESSPVLLGISFGGGSGAHATAYKSFRLMAANSIAKAARKAKYWKSGIRRALGLCCRLAQQIPGTRFDVQPIGVTLRDGIPLDGLEEAQRISTLRASGTMSVSRAVRSQIDDPAEAQQEICELARENEQARASISFGPPSAGPDGTDAATPPPGEEEQQAAAAEREQEQEVAA